jgi:DNA-binding transcriptional LysR family regulator
MDRIDSMTVFAKVVASRSFSAAARELQLSQAAVSKHVRSLEDWLGARLLNRTTRRLSVTEIGALVYERCGRIADEIEEIQHHASAMHRSPRGLLRVAAPVSIGVTHLGAAMADYLALYREVSLDLTVSDATVDLVEGGFDMAIRIGHLEDSSLIARRLAPIRFVTCAAPAYVAQHGAPRHPDDLTRHDCVYYSYRTPPGEWRFMGPAGEVSVRISGRLRANNGNLLRGAVLAGRGIGLAPSFVVGDDLAARRLVPLLPDYVPIATEMHAVYPPGRHLSAKVRSLIDFLAARFAEPGWDDWQKPVAAAEIDHEQE